MKKVFFITTIALALLASCKETKKEEAAPNLNRDNNAEMVKTQDSIQMARKKTMDSLEQVKSHGHAH
jgi:preprotein translocase subunit SecG